MPSAQASRIDSPSLADAHRVTVRLDHPHAVNGVAVRYQSLWLLVRLYYAARFEHAPVSLAAIKARFAQATDLRMTVSRAFSDFTRWGIAAGWGEMTDADVRLLPTRGRGKGPFWLDSVQLARLRLVCGEDVFGVNAGGTAADTSRIVGTGRRRRQHARQHANTAPQPDAASTAPRIKSPSATHHERATLAAFLGMPAPSDATTPDTPALDYVMQDIAFWHHITLGKRDLQDGVFLAPPATTVAATGRTPRSGAIESFHAAQVCAVDETQRGIALLAETIVWRRMGDAPRANRTLDALGETFGAGRGNSPTLRAMHCIVQAWQAYGQRDEAGAQGHLQRLADDPVLAPSLVYNPRVRFECRNLQALLCKARAARPGEQLHRAQAASEALAAFSDALQAAFEADSIELAQHVAANMGLSLWLFWQEGLIDAGRRLSVADVQRQSLRWIGLSEWICDRFGVGGNSVWNTVFLLRIARGATPARRDPDLSTLRASTPLSVAAFLDAVQPFGAPFSRAKGFLRWTDVIATTLADHEDGRVSFEPLQLANLWFEQLWFTLHQDGESADATHAAQALGRVLPQLPPPDRRFFREALRLVPRDYQREVRDAR